MFLLPKLCICIRGGGGIFKKMYTPCGTIRLTIEYLYARFASGSKDGTARIWSYKAGEWHSVQLVIKAEDGRTVHYNTYKKCEEPLR